MGDSEQKDDMKIAVTHKSWMPSLSEYTDLLENIKRKIQEARVKAALSVNQLLVLLYWDIGYAIIERQTYARWGSFTVTLPSPESNLAQQLIKDPYNFDFLGIRQDVSELALEQALIGRLRDFCWNLARSSEIQDRKGYEIMRISRIPIPKVLLLEPESISTHNQRMHPIPSGASEDIQ